MKLTKLEYRFIDTVRAAGYLYGGPDNSNAHFALFYIWRWEDDPAVISGLKRAARQLIRKGAIVEVPGICTFDDSDKAQPLYTVTLEAIEAYRNSEYVSYSPINGEACP